MNNTAPEVSIDILNEGHVATQQLLIENFSGCMSDLSLEMQKFLRENASLNQIHQLQPGDWITVVDGEIISMGQFLPYRISVTMKK